MTDEKERVVIEVHKDLHELLKNIQEYIKDESYGAVNPSLFEASKFLVVKVKGQIKLRGGLIL